MTVHLLAGGVSDAVALCVDATPGEGARVLWFGDWPDAQSVGVHHGPAPRQRWGARLDDPPRVTLVPGAGAGYLGAPAMEFMRRDGRWSLDARTQRTSGDARLGTLDVFQQDATAELSVSTHFALDPSDGSLRVHTRVCNDGADAVDLRWLSVLALPLPHWCGHARAPVGDWCAEFHDESVELGETSWLRESREGRSSHRTHPGVLLHEAGCDARRGRVLGVQFAWSGDHRMRVDRLADGTRVLQVGVLFHPGECALAPGAALSTPDLWLACSARGFDGATARMHALYRRHVRPRSGQRHPRPVHLNTWEAVYFDHDPAALMALADTAADLGVERFVLDDGWFLDRTSDRRALGDWQVDPVRYPEGLEPLIERVVGRGMEFGLWVEPEMINDDSRLARAHPDWIRGPAPGRAPLTGRHQRVLDLSLAPVRDHLFQVLDGLLTRHAIGYLKWDHNRALTESAQDGTAGHHAQTLGVHALLDRLTAAHPDLEIETCASGGGRADLGMLARTHRVWVSDCNDPVLRARIMAGATPYIAPEAAGCHIGPERAHTTGRRTALDFRAAVALFGAFGLELDVRELGDDDRARLAAHIERYKRWRGVIGSGHVSTRTPDVDHLIRVFTASDRRRALIIVLRLNDASPGRGVQVTAADLDPDLSYRVALSEPLPDPALQPPALVSERPWAPPGAEVGGAWLMSAGLVLQLPAPQRAVVLEVTATTESLSMP